MIDRLVVISPWIRKKFADLALEHGKPARGYKRMLRLREYKPDFPVCLYLHGLKTRTPIHKIEFETVRWLGLPRVAELVEAIFGTAERVRIYRLDACVDICGTGVPFFARNCRVPGAQSFALFRKRAAMSVYLQNSSIRQLLFYNKRAEYRTKHSPLVNIGNPGEPLTRFEVRFIGAGVPVRRFTEISRYGEINLVGPLVFSRLRVDPDTWTPVQFLAAEGLRALIRKYGLHATSKMFSPPRWASINKAFLVPMAKAQMPNLNLLLRRSVRDWLAGRIRYPRLREIGEGREHQEC